MPDSTSAFVPARPRLPCAVLLVCLGNICRSPLAKAILTHHARERRLLDSLRIDSCGTGTWHVGKPADPRTILVAQTNGVPLAHTARTLDPDEDFETFDLIVAMDQRNKADLLSLGASPHRVRLMRSYDPALRNQPEHLLDVPDPYYGGHEGFQRVFDMLWTASNGLLDDLTA